MKIKKMIPYLIGLLVLLLAASYTLFIAPLLEREVAVYEETSVFKGDLNVEITESGYLEYQTHEIAYDIDLIVENEESTEEEKAQKYLTIEEVYVAQGELVGENAPLIKFSEDSIASVRRALESALADAAVEYNDAEAEYRQAVLEEENTLNSQQMQAGYAQEIYSATISQIEDEISILQMDITKYQEMIPEYEEALTEAQTTYSEAKYNYERMQEAYLATGIDNIDNYLEMQSNFEKAKSTYERAESSKNQARKQLDSNADKIADAQRQLEQLIKKKNNNLIAAEQEYKETLLSGENATYSYTAAIESLKEDLKESEENKKKYEEKIADFEELVGTDGIIHAPADARIASISYETGDVLERTGTILTYILEEDMTISVDITQEDVVNLSVDDEVSIMFTAYEGEAYKGTVSSINTSATSQDTPTISYEVVIEVEGTLEKLYGGMSADVTFITKSLQNTIYINRKALQEQNGKAYVWVQGRLGEKELREVTTGIRNESYVEILSGLDENDRIFSVTYEKRGK